MEVKIGNFIIDPKVVAKLVVFVFTSIAIIILLFYFVKDGISWTGFIEFITFCLLLIFLIEKSWGLQ